MSKLTMMALVASVSVIAATPAVAQSVITDPATSSYSAGIGPNGELYDAASGIGLQNPAGSDYISPGTPRDSWGITGSTGSAYADSKYIGTSGIASTTSTFLPHSATFVTTTNSGFSVTQNYNFFASNILSIQETVTNITAAAISGIVFRREVDLDIPPTTFNENVFGVIGSNSQVVANSYYGFESPDPAVAYSFPCGASCNTSGDLGAGIDIGVGTLDAGASATFAYYYGINAPGQTLDGLFTEAQGLGLNYLIGAQSRENGDYPNLGSNSGFLGVSSLGTTAGPSTGAVPESATWAMMLSGFGLGGAAMRRRKVNVRFA